MAPDVYFSVDVQIKEHLTTSIDLFTRGYRSVYVNEVKEILAADKTLATEIQVIFNEELFHLRHSMLI